MQVVAVPRDQYGKFYRGDSYIVLAMSEYGSNVNVNTKVNDITLISMYCMAGSTILKVEGENFEEKFRNIKST